MDDRQTGKPRNIGDYAQPQNRSADPRPAGSGSIRIATPADLRFILHLQKKFGNQIGFLPLPALQHYLETGCISIINENDTPAGYLLGRNILKWQPALRPITQAAIATDAQRRHLGLALVKEIERQAIDAGQLGVQANCAADLEANDFWKAAGFVAICHLQPLNARKRDIICWRKPLAKKLPIWFANPPKRAGHQAHHARVVDRQRRTF